MNVLTNAIDVIEESKSLQSKQIKIQTLLIDSQWVQIIISDTGIGMSEDVLQRALLIQNMNSPPTPNYGGEIYFKVPQSWGI